MNEDDVTRDCAWAPLPLAQVGEAAEFVKLLANEGRLAILCLLLSGPKSVGELEAGLGAKQSSVSQHLARLRRQGLVEANRSGKWIHYRIADPRVERVIGALRKAFCPGQ